MSSNTSTQINSSDPSVARQVQRENSTVQRQATLASAPSVNGSAGATTTSASQAVRSIAPIVSGSEVVYPQSTTTTSSNAVTINSSVNNDVGDVTTVYSTNGQITVNPINQTINQYTSTESGVSQIVAGGGVTITSSGASGTGIVTINATGGAGNVGNIAVLNLDGNAANVLHGDGTWSADQTTYGNSNVVGLMAAFGSNTITTTGNVSVGNIIGNGQALTNIAGANVSGFVPNANVANTAFAVAAANVSGLGNIATINLDGSTSNVLYGNGVFAAVAGGANTGNVTFSDQIVLGTGSDDGTGGLYLAPGNASIANSAVQYLRVRGGDVATHIHLDTGNNAYYDQYFGADSRFVKLEANGNVVINADDYNGNGATWTLDTTGNLTLAGGNSVIYSIANSSLDPTLPNVNTMTLTPDQSYIYQSLVLDPTSPGHIHLRAVALSNIDDPSANLFLGGENTAFEITYGSNNEARIHSGGNTWAFDNTGNLIFPRDAAGNIDPILSIVGGATPTIVSTDASLTGPANLAIQADYLNLSGFSGDKIVLYADTGEIATDANMTLTTNLANTGNTSSWTFSDDGLLTLPGGNVTIGNVLGGEAILASNTPFGVVSQGNGSTVLQWIDDIANATALSAIYINSPSGNTGDVAVLTGEPGANANIWAFGADGILTFPGTPRIDTDANNFEVQAAEAINFEANTVVNIYTDTGNTTYQWQFGDNGNLTLPDTTSVIANASITLEANSTGNITGLSVNGDADANLYAHGNVKIVSDSGNATATWSFGLDGNLTIPNNVGGFIKTASNASIGIVAMDNGTNNPAQLLSMNVGNGNATSIISAYATNATIQTNAAGAINTWSFDNAGNLTLPANTFAINYANGTQVSLGGGNISNISNGNSNVSIATANGNVTISAVGNTTMTVTGTGANVTGTLTSTGKIGYASGSTVTQLTSRGTGVTINALAGTIVTTSAAMVATEIDTFSVVNSSVDPNNDIVLAQIVSPNQGTYDCIANPAVIGGFNDGFYINIVNISGFTTADETITIRFMVFKAPNA